MNKRQIIASLNKIANELDATGLYTEANTVTKVMTKLAEDFDPGYDSPEDRGLLEKFNSGFITPTYIGAEQKLYNPKEFDLIVVVQGHNDISVGPIPISEFYNGSTFNRYSLGNSLSKVFDGGRYDPQDVGSDTAQSLDIDDDNKIVTLYVRYDIQHVLKETHPALQQLAEELNDKIRKNFHKEKYESDLKPIRGVLPDQPHISYQYFPKS